MIKSVFASSIYYAKLKPGNKLNLNKDLIVEANKIAEIDAAGKKWSKKNYPGGFTSYASMCQLHRFSSTFASLENDINKHVAKYIKYLELDISPSALKMSTCWVNIMPPNVTHTMHIHPLSVISGTYYLKTPPHCSSIKFEDPRLVNFMATPPRKTNASEKNQPFINVKPQEGSVVLFESWMRHEVPPNSARSSRYSISFNYDWIE